MSCPGGCFISQPVNSHAGRTSWLKQAVPPAEQSRLNTCCLRAASLSSGAMELYSLFYIYYCLKTIILKAWLVFASNCDIACFICCLFKKFRWDKLSEWPHRGYSLPGKKCMLLLSTSSMEYIGFNASQWYTPLPPLVQVLFWEKGFIASIIPDIQPHIYEGMY